LTVGSKFGQECWYRQESSVDAKESTMQPESQSTPYAGLWHDVSRRMESSALELGGGAFIDGTQLLGGDNSKRWETSRYACLGHLAEWHVLLQYRATLTKVP